MKVSTLTIVFLVVLRLAIGWHFFYEGVWKWQHKDSWSSKGYLTAAKGPGALPSRWIAGDPTVTRNGWQLGEPDYGKELPKRFAAQPISAKEQASLIGFVIGPPSPGFAVPPAPIFVWYRLPEAVNDEWDDYFDRFVKHYKLNEQENRATLERVRVALQTCKDETAYWLAHGEEKADEPSFVRGSLERTLKTPERVEKYLAQVRKINEIEGNEQEMMKAATRTRLAKANAEEKSLRTALYADLDALTTRMKKELHDALTEQERMAAVLKEKEPDWKWLPLIDGVVRWGLLVSGLCLLFGFLTRPACVAALSFLLMFYLAAPCQPLGPLEPQAKEHFYLVNWNIIECVALLMLATTPSGRWLGLDGLCQFVFPWNWRRCAGGKQECTPTSAREASLRNSSEQDRSHSSEHQAPTPSGSP